MRFSFVVVALFAGYVVAADDVPPCVETCARAAAKSSNCGSYKSKACVCESKEFDTAARKCITSKCSSKDQAAALEYRHQLCDK